MNFLNIRGGLSRKTKIIFGIGGVLFVLAVWSALTLGENPVYPPIILPSPLRVLDAFGDLYVDNNLIGNVTRSIGLNLAGYVEAIVISIPIGFAIGLVTPLRGMFLEQIEGIRFLPLVAVLGLFIVWFGVGTPMKVHFLAVGIIIYLLPMIIQRIDEVNDVYIKTVYTIGATDWQTIKTVHFPSVMSRISDDIRVLTAISWTYIIVVEGGIASTGGVGSLIWRMGMRQGRMDKAFALLILIILIGIIQDRLFVRLDKYFFPHKYQQKDQEKSGRISEESLLTVIRKYAMKAVGRIILGLYFLLFLNELFGILGDFRPLSELFADTVWTVHLIMLAIIAFTVRDIWRARQLASVKRVVT